MTYMHLINNQLYLVIMITDFKFNFNIFSHFKSCLHVSVCQNIILNHLCRIKNLCSLKYKNKNHLFSISIWFPLKKLIQLFISSCGVLSLLKRKREKKKRLIGWVDAKLKRF